MYSTINVHPEAGDVRPWIFSAASSGQRHRLLLIHTSQTRIEILIDGRATLDAFQSALDAIRVDMDAAEAPAAEMPIADMAPGELVGVFGK